MCTALIFIFKSFIYNRKKQQKSTLYKASPVTDLIQIRLSFILANIHFFAKRVDTIQKLSVKLLPAVG